jgi:Domain of unknown function (DUF4412)
MRCSTLLYLLPVLTVVPAAAQAFEGTVTMKMPVMGEGATATYLIKGDKSTTVMTLGGDSGPMAGKEMRMIIDRATMKSTMLIATEMMGGKGIKIVTDLSKPPASPKGPVEVRELGTTDMIAGLKCDNIEVSEGKDVHRICIARDLGMFAMPGAGGGMMGRSASPSSGWTSVFVKHPGFPLRVSDGSGKVIMEVTGIQRGPIPESSFVVPDGYMDMGSIGRMGGRGGN